MYIYIYLYTFISARYISFGHGSFVATPAAHRLCSGAAAAQSVEGGASAAELLEIHNARAETLARLLM